MSQFNKIFSLYFDFSLLTTSSSLQMLTVDTTFLFLWIECSLIQDLEDPNIMTCITSGHGQIFNRSSHTQMHFMERRLWLKKRQRRQKRSAKLPRSNLRFLKCTFISIQICLYYLYCQNSSFWRYIHRKHAVPYPSLQHVLAGECNCHKTRTHIFGSDDGVQLA